MLFNLSHFPGVAESVRRSTIIDVRASEASVFGIAAEISRSGLGYCAVVLKMTEKPLFSYPVYDSVCNFLPLYMTNLKLLNLVYLFLF